MPTETAQILCTVWWNTNEVLAEQYRDDYGLYKPFSNRKHPSILWTQASIANYLWVVDLLEELCKEFEFRYGHKHKCQMFVDLFRNRFGLPPLLKEEWVPMSFEYQAITNHDLRDEDPVVAYMMYYIEEKRSFAQWKKTREAPGWWLELIEEVEIR